MRPTDLPHAVDEDGGHDLDECYPCLAAEEVRSECRCGACCRNLTLNACVEDAHVEPRIRELCAATRDPAGRLTGSTLWTDRAHSWTDRPNSAPSVRRGRSCAAYSTATAKTAMTWCRSAPCRRGN
jgi:hypothetical protein